jgi:SAM-dependent methyltransferase
MTWQERTFGRYYDRSKGFVDGTTEFHRLCAGAIHRGAAILDIGAGPSNPTSDFLATLGAVTGLDVDPEVQTNRALSDAEVFDGTRFPFPDGSFDACASNYVVEHVPNSALHLQEVRRVLRPGGIYVFRTPNRFHYVGLVSSVTPHWVHELLAGRLRGLPRDAYDHPTVYAMNSRGSLRKHAHAAALEVEVLRMIEKDPFYARASRLLFYPFMAYERLVNSSEALAGLRANILAVLRKSRA